MTGLFANELQRPPPTLLSEVPQHARQDLPPAMATFPATQPETPKPPADPFASALTCKTGQTLEAAMKVGIALAGELAQDPPSFLADREIFRRTLMCGKTVVQFKDVSLRKVEQAADGKKSKLSVRKAQWEQVMAAGLSQYPVGKLEDAGTEKARVLFAEIPTEASERVQMHNMLVRACQVTLRQWADQLSKQAKKRRADDEGDTEEPRDTEPNS